MQNLKIRNVELRDVDTIKEYINKEDWNPGDGDVLFFAKHFPEYFYVGEINNEVVCSVLAIPYGDNFSFIGLFIAKEELRQQGFGKTIGEHLLKNIKTENLGCDAVLKQVQNYNRYGFDLHYNNVRYSAIAPKHPTPKENVFSLRNIIFDDIINYDKKCFQIDRPKFIDLWMHQQGSYGYYKQKNGQICGLGLIRPATEGYSIGPLYGDTYKDAIDVLSMLLNEIPDQPFYIDIPESNKSINEIISHFNLSKVTEFGRMYTNGYSGLPIAKVYGVTCVISG
ncbi:MAG: GNAT family N-acetyltransferase [Hyphomicrobiales bacterium]